MSWRFGLGHHRMKPHGGTLSLQLAMPSGRKDSGVWKGGRTESTLQNIIRIFIYIYYACVCVFPPGTLGRQAAALKFLVFLHEKRKFHPGFKVLRARIMSPTRLQRPLEPLDDATGRKNLQKWIELVDF